MGETGVELRFFGNGLAWYDSPSTRECTNENSEKAPSVAPVSTEEVPAGGQQSRSNRSASK